MQGFAEPHFIGENPAEAVLAEEGEPGDALFLVGTQDGVERAERRAVELDGAGLLEGAVAPGGGGDGLPALLGEGRLEEAGLGLLDAVTAGVLFGGGIDEDFFEFFDGTGVDEGDAAVFEAGMVLAAAEQALDFGGGEAFSAGGGVGDLEIEPLFPGGGDGEAGFDTFEILAGGAVEAFLEGDLPFAFEAWEFAGEEGEDGILAVQVDAALSIGAGEAETLEALEGIAFGGEVAGVEASDVLRIRHPGRFIGNGDTGGDDTRSVEGVELTGEGGETAREVEGELGRERREFEVCGGDIGFEVGGSLEDGEIGAEERGNLGA